MSKIVEDSATSLLQTAATRTTFPPAPPFHGFHCFEPDVVERGVWVERSVRIPVPALIRGRVSVAVTGMYFPKLIQAHSGSGEMQLSVSVGGSPVRTAVLSEHGSFQLRFEIEVSGETGRSELMLACNRCFVPAQIGHGNDQRELCWRLKSLAIDNLSLFDCAQRLNVLLFEADTAPMRTPSSAGLRFHLDSPGPGVPVAVDDRLVVSGWACDVASGRTLAVRVNLAGQDYETTAVARSDVRLALAPEAEIPLATGFTVSLDPPIGVLPLRVQTQLDDGTWRVQKHGYVINTPLQRRPAGGKLGHWLMSAMPQALRSRALDRLRGLAPEMSKVHLPSSYRFHLDTPQVDGISVHQGDCIVSGWVFDEATYSTVAVRVVVGQRKVAAHVKQREDVQTAFRAHGALPQHVGFACVLNLPIGLHRIWIELRTPDGHWVAVRRASLLRLPAIGVRRPGAAHKSLASYLRARRKFEQAELPEIQRHIRVMLVRPHFTVLIDCPRFDASLKRTLASLRQQVYPHFDIRVRSMRASASLPAWVAPGTLLSGLGLPSDAGDFVMFINSGDELHERTLYEFADAINKNAHADLIYADELHLRPRGGPPLPFYKPEWSPDYLETFNYIGFTACFRSALVRECTGPGGPMGRYDMTLRITEHSQHIIHLPKLLGQARTMNAVDDAGASDDIAALSARLERTGRAGTVRQHAVQKGCYDIELKLRRQPLVSIVIPTAGKTITLDGRQIDLLANVIEQIASRSTYPNFELVIVDNDDLSPSQLEILSRHACKRATYRERQFNIAKKLNLGVTVATGDLLLLMNDDIEILTPNWIERMVEHFEKPHVGVVGGKLLYPDSRTQHVGVVHNSGNPDHVRRLYPRDDAGYFFSTCGVRNFGAVTGACMMTRASVYRRVGGYSEALAVSYNDADYCLKVAECGLYTVYAPAVELTHMESQSRVASADPEEVIWYHARWASTVISDRFYNERFLSVASPTFVPVINERLV